MGWLSSGPTRSHRETDVHSGDPGHEQAFSILAADLRVEGDVQTSGVVTIEGTVVGNVRAQRQVTVVKGGTVQGDIHTREAILGGELKGSVLADERVELQASAVIQGSITTPRLVVHEGAAIDGYLRMSKAEPVSSKEAAAPAAPAPVRRAVPF